MPVAVVAFVAFVAFVALALMGSTTAKVGSTNSTAQCVCALTSRGPSCLVPESGRRARESDRRRWPVRPDDVDPNFGASELFVPLRSPSDPTSHARSRASSWRAPAAVRTPTVGCFRVSLALKPGRELLTAARLSGCSQQCDLRPRPAACSDSYDHRPNMPSRGRDKPMAR